MTLATLQDYKATVWNTSTTPKASPSSLTWQTGDVFIVGGLGENNSVAMSVPTATGLTFSLAQNINVASFCEASLWTAVAASGGSGTYSVSNTGSTFLWGHHVYQFRGSNGVGASNKANSTTGDPTVTLSTTQANSSIVCYGADWNAGATTGKAWLPLVGATTPSAGNGFEKVGAQQGSSYTVYSAYYNDAGAIGSKSVGMTDPNGMQWAFIAVEVKGLVGTPTLVGSYFMPFFS
jgi:hypothetical protein